MPLKPEQIIQINLINWFKYEWPELSDDVHHFANERKCSYKEGRNLKRMGVIKGVSDLFLALPTSEFHGLWIELKTEHGRLSNEQMEFIKRKNQRGYFAIAVWGLEAAKEVIVNYLKDYVDGREKN